MLSHHARKRDNNGLPILYKSIKESEEDNNDDDNKACSSGDCSKDTTGWNRDHMTLDILTKQAAYEIEKVKFIQRWLMPHLHLNVYPGTQLLALQTIDTCSDRSVRKELELLLRIKDCAVQVQSNLATAAMVIFDHAVSDIRDTFKSRGVMESLHCSPQGFLRRYGPESNTEHDGNLGFLSSAWKTCKPATDFEDLQNRGELSVASLQSHCEEYTQPSEWISMASEVSWMLKQISRSWLINSDSAKEMRVALISTAKMERLGVLFDRSDLLVKRAGGELWTRAKPGVKFAWPIHYLAYGCVPKQCIVKTFTLQEFRDVCSARNIRPDGLQSIDPFKLLSEAPDTSIDSV
ncbi:MAG: hypothetical protein Q9192_004565, partial [Flavoplaca navasiana]